MKRYIEKHAVNGGDKFIDFAYSQIELEKGEIDLLRHSHFLSHNVDTNTSLLIRTKIIAEKSNRIRYDLFDSIWSGDFNCYTCNELYEYYKMYGKYFTKKQCEEIWEYLREYGKGEY